MEDWYDEYDILIWIGSVILGLLLLCCIYCYCAIKCKSREAQNLRKQFKEIQDRSTKFSDIRAAESEDEKTQRQATLQRRHSTMAKS